MFEPRLRLHSTVPLFSRKGDQDQAEVIVANHDLVLADLALGGGIMLPPPEDSIYLFDEAHHLPEKPSNIFPLKRD